MTLERVEQHAEVATLKLTSPFWGLPRVASWLRAYSRQWQALEDALWSQLDTRTIDAGDYERLRVIGSLIGQAPAGFALEVYRRVLRGRALANRSDGASASLTEVITAVFGASAAFSFAWVGPASIHVTGLVDVSSEEARAIATVLPHARGAGVSLQVITSETSGGALTWTSA